MSGIERTHHSLLRPLGTRVGVFLGASLAVGAGVALMVRAELGVTPVDVLNTGLADHSGLDVGLWSSLVAGGMAVLAWSLRRRPNLGTLAGSILVGGAIGVMLQLLNPVDHEQVVLRSTMLLVGLVVVYGGINGIVSSGVGTGPLELVMLAFGDRGVRLDVARWGLEAVIFAAGLSLGGQTGIGTALFALCTGPVLARTLPPTMRWMGTDGALPAVAIR